MATRGGRKQAKEGGGRGERADYDTTGNRFKVAAECCVEEAVQSGANSYVYNSLNTQSVVKPRAQQRREGLPQFPAEREKRWSPATKRRSNVFSPPNSRIYLTYKRFVCATGHPLPPPVAAHHQEGCILWFWLARASRFAFLQLPFSPEFRGQIPHYR